MQVQRRVPVPDRFFGDTNRWYVTIVVNTNENDYEMEVQNPDQKS